MYEDWKFERWETPVSDEPKLSMRALIDNGEKLTIIIAGFPLPSKHFRFTFTVYPAYRNINELYRIELWNMLYREKFGHTLIIPKSKWIESFRESNELLDAYHPRTIHYLICTYDGCVEVLSDKPPEITEVEVNSNEGIDYELPSVC